MQGSELSVVHTPNQTHLHSMAHPKGQVLSALPDALPCLAAAVPRLVPRLAPRLEWPS